EIASRATLRRVSLRRAARAGDRHPAPRRGRPGGTDRVHRGHGGGRTGRQGGNWPPSWPGCTGGGTGGSLVFGRSGGRHQRFIPFALNSSRQRVTAPLPIRGDPVRAFPSRAAVLLGIIAAAVGGVAVVAGPGPAGAVSPDITISQVYGGGGNTGAPWANDFIALYNRGGSSGALAGWSVQYASAAGTTWQVTTLSGSLAPGLHYLIREAAGAGGGAQLPTPDATGNINMSATSAKVALVTSTAALTCGSVCHAAAGVRDYIGYGSANDW